MAFTRGYAARRIQRAFRRRRVMRAVGRMRRKGAYIRRSALGNPMPTFVETFKQDQAIAGNLGGVFSVRITDIPQIAQYAQLYKQYRINWVKVMLIPDWNSAQADHNAAAYNASLPIQNFGMARIAFAINNSPQLVAPVNEAIVLQDNGCKIKVIGQKWSTSFKPVPDVGVTSGTTANPIWTRQKFRQWFNFDTTLTGNNPLHYGVSYFITQLVANTTAAPTYNVYYKVSFSLRDPQ